MTLPPAAPDRPSLRQLLARCGVDLVPPLAPLSAARARQHLWQALFAQTETFYRLRRAAERQALAPHGTEALARRLTEAGLLAMRGAGRVAFAGPEARRQLMGGWLEELAACAAADAGADEVVYGQRFCWSAPGTQLPAYVNEVDLIARFGQRLLLASAKAMDPRALHGHGGEADDKLTDAIFEIHYWSAHLTPQGAPDPAAALITTVDLHDETMRRDRHPGLMTRADVLDITLISPDLGSYGALVARLKALLA